MRQLNKLIAFVLAGYIGYVVWLNYPRPAPSSEIVMLAPTSKPTPVPEPMGISPAPAPTTSAPELAPEGVFYLLAPSRVETVDGLYGLPPGTGVKLVRPGIYLTPYGEVPLDPALLTNDMGKARAARAAERAAQGAAHPRIATEGARVAETARTTAAAEAAQDSQEQAGEAAKVQAAAQRNARIAKLREQIAAARSRKAHYLDKRWQGRANDEEVKIRALQQELRGLGVAGAMLE